MVLPEDMLNLVDGIRVSHKGSGNKIKALLDAKQDILFILIRNRRQAHLYIGHIDTFSHPQLSAV